MVKLEFPEGMLWQKERNGVRCYVCARKCFISKDKRGYCQVRKNVNNRLFVLNYGKILNTDITCIEKNPLYHFYPSAKTLAIFSLGNNFPDQTQLFTDKNQEKVVGKDYEPEDVVKLVEKNNCLAITYSATEPFMNFEFMFRISRLIRRINVKNTIVTNGFLTEESIKKVAKYADAFTVNLLASLDPEFYKKFLDVQSVNPVFDVLKQIRKQRTHLEITNLIIPQVGDNMEQCKKLAQWISSELDPETPFHILQFYPDNRFPDLPITPVPTLEVCTDTAKKTGLRHVYIGNTPDHPEANTYCYNCRETLVERKGFVVKRNRLIGNRCPNCGVRINVVIE